ncbi:hypothetical protein BDY24DRAFT_419112 [Mrakia frigida]|uniref:uncharacterized protein n=1 Tax=Mrakia frigida TaxID=29902 RepID=UPI003FCBF90B
MGYRVEYAAGGNAACKGPAPCKGFRIAKGELRFGTTVDFNGKTTWAWRHWGCVTPKVIANVKTELEGDDPELLDGYEVMTEEDQARITKAWEAGEIDPADKSTHVKPPVDPLSKLTIPELKEKLEDADLSTKGTKDVLVARLREHEGPAPEEDSDAEGAKKGKGKGKAAKAKNGDDAKEKKPTKKKAKKAASSDEEESEAQDSEEEEKPAKKSGRKLVKRSAAKKEDSDEESEPTDTGSDAESVAASSTAGPPKKTKKAAVGDKRKRSAKKEESDDVRVKPNSAIFDDDVCAMVGRSGRCDDDEE